MTTKQVIPIHGETGHMAIDVKTHGMNFASVAGETEQLRKYAWERACEQLWQDADTIAVECGFSGTVSEGRSSGWCVPYYQEKGTAMSYPDPDNARDRKRFACFQRHIDRLMANVPNIFEYELVAYVQYEHEHGHV